MNCDVSNHFERDPATPSFSPSASDEFRPIATAKRFGASPGSREWYAGPAAFCALMLALIATGPARAQGGAPAPSVSGPAQGGAPEGVIVQRTMMPDSGPSSFAVTLGDKLGFCYDPGRGGINYLWLGEFVDLQPTWKAKINAPAVVRGTIVYRESVRWPLRLNQSDREPKYTFKGYSLLPDGVEFHYLLDGIPVQEEIRALPEGRGLARRFRLGPGAERWWLFVGGDSHGVSSSRDAKWDAQRQALTGSGAREFTVTLELKGLAR